MAKLTLIFCISLLVFSCSSSPEPQKETTELPEVTKKTVESVELSEPEKVESPKFGCIEGDCVDGIGTYVYENGDVYKGAFAKDKRNGNGSFTYVDGEKFEGDYLEDQRQGKGIYTFKNGDKYEGEFQNGQIHGKGSYFFQDGKFLLGTFEKGANGEGELNDNGKKRPCQVKERKLLCEIP